MLFLEVVLGMIAGFCSRRTWNTAAHANSKIYSEIQCSIIFSLFLKYNFYTTWFQSILSRKDFFKMLGASQWQPQRQDFSACTGLDATFIINKIVYSVKIGLRLWMHFKSTHQNWQSFKKKESFSLATRCQLLKQHWFLILKTDKCPRFEIP